jgi:hypothetical protein
MAGAITISTLNNDTGVLATQNGMTGIAKAWVNINGNSGASPTTRASFNVSSVTRNSTGDYTINFTTAMPSADYCVNTCINSLGATFVSSVALVYATSQAGAGIGLSTTQLRIVTGTASSAAIADYGYVFVSVFSS